MQKFLDELARQKEEANSVVKQIKYERNKKSKKLTDDELKSFLPRMKSK